MERKDALVLSLMLGGLGWAGYTHWDEIVDKLGLDDLSPGRVKAIELCKGEYTFDRYRTNGAVISGRLKGGEIEADGEVWSAQRVDGDKFAVVCRYRERGQVLVLRFDVDNGSGAVVAGELEAAPPR